MTEVVTKLIQSAITALESMYSGEEHDYEILPIYGLATDGEVTHVVGLAGMPDTAAEKLDLVLKLRNIADEHGCNGWTFASEGWTLPQERLKDYAGGLRFSEQEDRVEIVSVQAGLKTGELAGASATITRTPGQSAQLTWSPIMVHGQDGNTIHSRFNIYDMQVPAADKLAAIRAEAAS